MSRSRFLSDEEIRRIETRRGELPDGPVDDPDNPEWTEEDFARARPPEEVLPPEILAQFPNTKRRGRPPKEDAKQVVTLRLRPKLIEAYRRQGDDWRAVMERVLTKGIDADAPQKGSKQS